MYNLPELKKPNDKVITLQHSFITAITVKIIIFACNKITVFQIKGKLMCTKPNDQALVMLETKHILLKNICQYNITDLQHPRKNT